MRRSISIVIPAYNEEKRLPATLLAVKAYLAATAWEFAEILVVDDGSRDGTVEIARRAGARVLQNPGNRGKGYSVRNGMLAAQGEWVLFSDADLSSPIEELEKLCRAAGREGRAQAAIGSRDLDRSLHRRAPAANSANSEDDFSTWSSAWSPGCRFTIRSAASNSFRERRHRRFSAASAWSASGSTWKCSTSPSGWDIATLEVPVRWNDVAGTKVKMTGALAAFLDPVKVRWNGLTGRYR